MEGLSGKRRWWNLTNKRNSMKVTVTDERKFERVNDKEIHLVFKTQHLYLTRVMNNLLYFALVCRV